MEEFVSIFKNATSTEPMTSMSFEGAMNAVKAGSFKDLVLCYRDDSTRENKIKIPCFTPSGTFSHRSSDGVEIYNSIICIDIDDKDNPDKDKIDSFIKQLEDNPFCLAYHKSVGGVGYAVYLRVLSINPEHHSKCCEEVMRLFSLTGINPDKACKDVSRLRFFSWDEDLFYNPNAKQLVINIPENKRTSSGHSCQYTEEDIQKHVMNLLTKVVDSGTDITDEYSEWVSVGLAIAETFGEDGRSIFHEVSALSSKYDARECDRLFTNGVRRAGSNSGTKVTYKALFQICKNYGIYNKN